MAAYDHAWLCADECSVLTTQHVMWLPSVSLLYLQIYQEKVGMQNIVVSS